MSVAPLKRHVLRTDVRTMIMDRLLSGAWAPGARLSIDGLARDLDVSPTPVREALVGLEQSGLVEYRVLRGYAVAAPLSPAQIDELVAARSVVESAALAAAIDGPRDELAADLRAAHSAHTERARVVSSAAEPDFDDLRSYFQADGAFHGAFFTHAGNRYLTAMHESLGGHAHRMRQTWSGGPQAIDAEQAVAEHAAILRHVESGDRAAALGALAVHLANVRERSGGSVA